jgi:hypothetical protein
VNFPFESDFDAGKIIMFYDIFVNPADRMVFEESLNALT